MNVPLVWLLVWLSLWLGACAWPSFPQVPSAPVQTREQVERRILVTFVNRELGRTVPGDPTDRYRARGDYATSTWSQRLSAQLAEDYRLRPVTEWPIGSLGVHCVVYEVAPEQSVERVLAALAQDRRVELAQKMSLFQVLGTGYNDPYFKLQAGSRAMHIEAAHSVATGRGVTVAVIDTGIDDTHPDLRGQVVERYDFVTGNAAGFAEDVHGTAVAGVIAAVANNGLGIAGVAPDAKLLALKACWAPVTGRREAVCNSLTLALALDKAIQLRPGVLNLSLTGPPDPLLARLIAKAVAERLIVVASAPAASDAAVFPASLPGVLAVHTAGPGFQAPLGAVAAPGTDILTTLPHGAYDFLSGSSFAAAHVSGVIALLLELKPGLMAERGLSDVLAGGGLAVDACRAVMRLSGTGACPESPVAVPTRFTGPAGGVRRPPG